jgi:hypothetical protein
VIKIIFLGNQTNIDRLSFVNGETEIIVNLRGKYKPNLPYVVEAFDIHDIAISEPKDNYFITNDPVFVSIDSVFGYLSVDASNVTSYQTYNFQVVARSATNPNISVSLPIHMTILDTTLNDLFVFDFATNTIIKTGVKLSQYLKNNQGILTIPNVIQESPVYSLADGLFQSNLDLKEIILPNTITSIGARCFESSSNLTSITIQSNPIVGTSAFSTGNNNTNLKIASQAFADQIPTMFVNDVIGTQNFSHRDSTGGWKTCQSS